MKKLILLVAALVLVGLTAAGPALAAKSLTFAIGAEPVRLDPPNVTDNPSEMVVRVIHDNLVTFDNNLNIVPMLAKSWEVSKDGMVYKFHLRQGVKFHDGEPFNAEAVVFNIKRNLDPDKMTRRTKLYLPFIKDVKALDAYTVELDMKQPFGAILAHLAHTAGGMVSPAAFKKWGDKYSQHPCGTGPYKFKEWIPGEQVVVEANKNFWGAKKPRLDEIIYKAVPEASSRVIMLETGEAQVAYPIPLIEVARLKKMKGVHVVLGNTTRVMYIGMNLKKKPFDNVKVRQAINYAIDKKSIIKNVLKGQASVSKSMIAKLVWGYKDSGYYAYNPAKAKQLLKEAGYPNGFETNMWTPEGRYPMDAQISEAAVGMLAKVGIKAKLRKWEWASYLKTLRKGPKEATHDMYFLGWSPSTGDADWGLRPLFATDMWAPAGANREYYSNPAVDAGLTKGMGEFDPAQRKATYAKVQKTLVDDAAWVMLHDMVQSVGVSDKVGGVIALPLEFVLLREAYYK